MTKDFARNIRYFINTQAKLWWVLRRVHTLTICVPTLPDTSSVRCECVGGNK